jgi:hypothetical protein
MANKKQRSFRRRQFINASKSSRGLSYRNAQHWHLQTSAKLDHGVTRAVAVICSTLLIFSDIFQVVFGGVTPN